MANHNFRSETSPIARFEAQQPPRAHYFFIYQMLVAIAIKDKVDKTVAFLRQGDFRAADVKKMANRGFYRAKLDDTNRLLFTIGTYRGRKYLFVLETILNCLGLSHADA